LATGFIPGWLFIGGAINNDVMVMALWPWLALCCIRFFELGVARDFWLAVILLGLLVLTKSTVWLLALIVAASLFVRNVRKGLPFDLLREGKHTALPAILVVGLVAFFLITNQWRYGHIQPTYLDVHDLPLQESKFWSLPEDAPFPTITWSYTWERSHYYLMRGWTGILSHNDLIEKPNLQRLAFLAQVAWLLLSLAFVLTYLKGVQRRWIIAWILILPLQYALLLIFNHLIYPKYLVHAIEGRYLIGSVQLSLLVIMISLTVGWQGLTLTGQRITGVVFTAGIAIWLWVFCDPLFFNRHTASYLGQSRIVEAISKHMETNGYRPNPIRFGKPQAAASYRNVHQLPKHYALEEGYQLLFVEPVPVQLVIYAEGHLAEKSPKLTIKSDLTESTHELGYDAEMIEVQVKGRVEITAQGHVRIYQIWEKPQ
jgi:hypothetical protein